MSAGERVTFNEPTAAERERLAWLIEECAEVLQESVVAFHHWTAARYEKLQHELADWLAVWDAMAAFGDVRDRLSDDMQAAIRERAADLRGGQLVQAFPWMIGAAGLSVQAAAKILRFGYDDVKPAEVGGDGTTNRARLEQTLVEVVAAWWAMSEHDKVADPFATPVHYQVQAKWARLAKWAREDENRNGPHFGPGGDR